MDCVRRMSLFAVKCLMEAEQAKKWMAQWRDAATALEEFRVEELSRLDETQNAAIAMAFHPHGDPPSCTCHDIRPR